MKKQIITTVAALSIMSTGFSKDADAHQVIYKVQSGDSLWKISSSNNLSLQELMQNNNLSSSAIHVGQELSLIAPHSHETTPQSSTIYTVKLGDSLSLIAKIHNTNVTELKSNNNLTSDIIKIGQVLKVPSGSIENQAPITTPTASKTYTVQSGDSLWRIATNYKLTVSQIKSYNNLTTDIIYVGKVLRLTSEGASSTPAPEVKPSLNVEALFNEAKKYIGVPYLWGGNTPSGFDCSGFLNYVYNKQGVTIPRTVATIWNEGIPISTPQKGDIVFFTTYAAGPSHAGIYIGDNKFIHAGSSTGVTITDMSNSSYWKSRYLGAKKVNL